MTCLGYLLVPVTLLVVTLGGPLERIDPTGTTDGVIFLAGTTVSDRPILERCAPNNT